MNKKSLNKATRLIQKWPKWKQQILGDVIPDSMKCTCHIEKSWCEIHLNKKKEK